MSHPRLVLRGPRVELRSTDGEDLPSLQSLWNNGEVMKWVGFPEGLGYDEGKTRRWMEGMHARPDRYHFCAYAPEVGFCGEVYCALDRVTRRAGLDIKFLPEAQGRGRSRAALGLLIRWTFETLPEADAVWTEPAPNNLAARTLYFSCGLRDAERPGDLGPGESYWELRRERWRQENPPIP